MSQTPPGRLRWRCRRGMQEMDILLLRWLDQCWAEASPQQQASFESLLASEDDQLWDWLSGRTQPEQPELAELVERIRNAAP